MEIIIGLLGGIVLIILVLCYSVLVYSLLFYKFYYWFLLPVFPEMPHITFLMAIGLACFFSVIKGQYIDELDDKYKDKTKKYYMLVYPWIVLLFGWLIKTIIH